MVEIAVYPTRRDAEFAQAALAAVGIQSLVMSDEAGGSSSLDLAGAASLLVNDADAAAAARLLAGDDR